MHQQAVFRLRAQHRDHIFTRFANRSVSAVWPLSLSTVTSAGEFRMPRHLLAPSARKNGASTFIPMWSYILENDVVRVLGESGRRLFVHCVITGGPALVDTLSGFAKLAETTLDQNVVLWVNEYFGRVERDGKLLRDLPVYRDHAAKVWARWRCRSGTAIRSAGTWRICCDGS